MRIIYIAPAFSDQAGQCRIYATDAFFNASAASHYKLHPRLWKEVGLMNSRGRLVCFEGTSQQRQDLTDDQPLMAGLTYTYNEELT